MTWKLYAFTGHSDRRVRYLESEAEYDEAGLLAVYEAARAELLNEPSLLDRWDALVYRDYPFPNEVAEQLVATHGFRVPEPEASAEPVGNTLEALRVPGK